jgi:hypothetical protein
VTAPLSVDPTALAATGVTVGGEGDAVATAIGALDAALSGAGAMFGHDAAGLVFGQNYTSSGNALLEAAGKAVNACRRVSFGVQTSASNYGHANAASTVGGGTSPVSAPSAPANFGAPSMPPPLGGGIVAPLGWALVEAFVGDVWPDGNPGEMRTAAGAWRSFSTTMSSLAGQVTAAGPGLGAQQIPEAGQMVSALNQIGDGLSNIATTAQAVATAVDGFATTVEATQNAVRGLLHQLSPSGILETIGGIFTGHDPMDEVRKVAHEIKTVLDNMKREADATGTLFDQGINALDSASTSLESWANKEFTHVLGKDVGGALAFGFTALVDESEGAFKFVAETAQGIGQLDPTRFLYDPSGAAKTWEGLGEAAAVVTNPALLAQKIVTDPQGSLDTVKGMVDWKDVEAGHPFRALGYDAAQVGSLLIPGAGEADAAADGVGIAGRAASVEERAATGAVREGVAGATSESVATQAGRVAKDLDGIKVPDSSRPGAAPGTSTPGERPPVDAPASPASAPGGRAPVDAPPVDTPRPESGPASVGQAPETQPHGDAPAPHTPDLAPTHLDAPAPVESGPAPSVGASEPPSPPGGVGSHESAPTAADTAPAQTSHSADMPAADAPAERTPVSVGAHGVEPGDSANGAGHGSGGGSGHEPGWGSSQHGGSETGRVDHPSIESPDQTPDPGVHDDHSGAAHDASQDAAHQHDVYELPPLDPDGYYPPGSLPTLEELRHLTATDPNSAFYWSGRDGQGIGVGPDDSGIAERIAAGSNGTTLEMTLSENGMHELPVWNRHDPESVRFWEDASTAYADNARGEVTAIVGSDLRPGNIWQNVEIPRLMENPNVFRIVQIDPDTGELTIIFERGR